MTASTNTATATNTGCALLYGDLRDWLAAVEAKGDLEVVTGANWHTDIGQVVEVMCHDEGTPSILFDEVEGCPEGFRILINWFTGMGMGVKMGDTVVVTMNMKMNAVMDQAINHMPAKQHQHAPNRSFKPQRQLLADRPV